MKKRIFNNKPTENSKGQYIFFNDLETEYSGSNSIPNYVNDKFSNKDLYTTVMGDEINKNIIEYKLQYPGFNFLRFDKLVVKNTGTGHRVHNAHFRAWMFDGVAFEENGGSGDDPRDASYDNIVDVLNGDLKSSKFYDYQHGTANARSWDPGTLIDNAELATDLSSDNPLETFNYGYSVDTFDIVQAFRHPWDTGDPDVYPPMTIVPFKPFIGQNIYVVVWCHGDDKRKGIGKYYTDHRQARLHIWKISADDLFTDEGTGMEKEIPLTYAGATKKEGESGGSGLFNKSAAMFTANEAIVTFNTNPSTTPQSFNDENLNAMTGSVQPGKFIQPSDYDSTFISTQHPYSELYNLSWVDYGAETLTTMSLDFNPVPKVTLSSDEQYTFQAYHTSSIDRQICSAPTQVTLNFDVCSIFSGSNYDLLTEDKWSGGSPGLGTIEQSAHRNSIYTSKINYKFFVVDWDDDKDKFKDVNDYIDDLPMNTFQLIKKRENNLYNFGTVWNTVSQAEPVSLYHSYQTPGIKTIKCVFYSETTEHFIQVFRWKFVKIRIFLDIPRNVYPDFGELGGSDYVTIPWPHTTPIIGGTDENSLYQISISNILGSAKIGDRDIIDERFLIDASTNDELGQSINQFDLEQIRYFTTGSYDMHKLLGLSESQITDNNQDWFPFTDNGETGYWNCEDWDGDRNKCFSEETSVGQIFIDDNLDIDLKKDCQFEFNAGSLTGKSIVDSSGNSNKGLLLGDYRIKKVKKNTKMKRDSYIRVPKKNNNKNGAL